MQLMNRYATKNSYLFNYSEDFTIPYSLENYLIKRSRDFDMKVINVTSNFKAKYFNINKTKELESLGVFQESLGIATKGSGVTGSSTGYSGGTIDGIAGSSYDK